VRPSVLTFDLVFACVWVMAIAGRGLRVKVIGQGQGLGLALAMIVTRSVIEVGPKMSVLHE